MIRFEDWGLIDYETALERQLELQAKVHDGTLADTVVFCTHPAVVTVGRKQTPEDIQDWKGPVVEISRGGRATYHGPNQLVIYPILDLRKERRGLPARDVHKYLRFLEELVVRTLVTLGVTALAGGSLPQESDKSYTGVWVGARKVASIGVGVKGWVTYHGIALNLIRDEQAFRGILPCGFQPETMISLEEILGKKIAATAVIEKIKAQILGAV